MVRTVEHRGCNLSFTVTGAGPAVVFSAGDDFDALLEDSANAGREASEIGRFTFADNPSRDPLVACLVTPPPARAPMPAPGD